MIVRRFLLENEKGQQIDMNNLKNSCFIVSPSNLGYSNESEFEQIGNTFIENNRRISKKDPSGIIYFKNYDKCKEFIDFVERSDKLRFVYIIPFKEGNKTFYRDVSIKEFEKTERKTGMLSCPTVFNGLSLWYEQTTTIYDIKQQDNEIRWDFRWDSRFTNYNSRNLQYANNGHIEAPILIEIEGHVINPKIELYIERELYQIVKFTVEIEEYEKLLYGTRENEFYINRQKTDGTIESLFSLDIIDFSNDNIIRLPKNKSCEIRLKADNEILNAKVSILTFYKVI